MKYMVYHYDGVLKEWTLINSLDTLAQAETLQYEIQEKDIPCGIAFGFSSFDEFVSFIEKERVEIKEQTERNERNQLLSYFPNIIRI